MESTLSASDFLQSYKNHQVVCELISALQRSESQRLRLKGLSGSSRALVMAACCQSAPGAHLAILNDKEEAAYLFSDLVSIYPDGDIFFFPSSYKRSVKYKQTLPDAIIQRTDTMNAVRALAMGSERRFTIVTYPDALVERVVALDELEQNSLRLNVGERVSTEFIVELLTELGFERVEFVYEPGHYAVRGGIIDIFSYSSAHPYRVDFFGDEVESIRSFDVNDQLSKEKHDRITIVPNLQTGAKSKAQCIVELLPLTTTVWIRDVEMVLAQMNDIYQQAEETDPDSIHNYASGATLYELLERYTLVEFGSKQHFSPNSTLAFSTIPQPPFQKNFELLASSIQENEENGYQTFILAQNPAQHQRLASILESINPQVHFTPISTALYQGFTDHDLKVCLYTDHQIFGRYHKFRLKHELSSRDAISLKELVNLQVGDYVVHVDHGIGTFGGLVKTNVNGKVQEAVRLVYKDNDSLLVNIHSLHRISKYKGKDNEPPRVYKLGSGAWQKLKAKTKGKVKDIARELIALYAKRREEKGYAFSPDTYLQQELEASFIYEDTPDQQKATQLVKEDMQLEVPMDRLVCGDVGFGKTEVAIRAAFKAVTDGKQVAMLVPTTILALQHFQTFKDRLGNFPCTIDFLSRMKSVKAIRETITKLADGKIDIVIGTHALLGSNIKFKDLGLLVIDEEQKFGVAAKEKLKRIRVNVDTLTLTATPIPRTLQFSLMGARDLSVINTPPPNRHPIVTELHSFNTAIIKEAIEYEVSRGGQVFFVHNWVQNIDQVKDMISKICPKVTITVGHGQMEPAKLEKTMLDFIAGDYDVLVATTIIESGLDIPNANTIIINNAQAIGLSDLHQLRGRVGRSNKRAFCYLLAPALETLTPEARRRLRAIEEFSELGSGFSIAMQDLDIRGAGNMLGGEQSGFIAEIGFETYHRILDEAMLELREGEFAYLFADSEAPEKPTQWKPHGSECHIETDLELLIPDTYVNSTAEKMRLYRELDSLKTPEQLESFHDMLRDRFGTIPEQTLDLLNVVRLRWLAVSMGIEKVMLKNGKLLGHFIANPESPFYSSDTFARIISFIQSNQANFSLKESKGKLAITAKNIKNVEESLVLLKQMQEYTR